MPDTNCFLKGYKHTNALWREHIGDVRGGSPFGAGTYAVRGFRTHRGLG